MDVTCERCGTEYEFDETLVSHRGTSVKCTNCGHLFKVFRPAGATEAAADAPERLWTVRKGSGAQLTLSSLGELQRLIATGELTEDDAISRQGDHWKPLGAIAELETFFAAARAGAEARRSRKDGTQPFATGEPRAARPVASPTPAFPPAAPPPEPPEALDTATTHPRATALSASGHAAPEADREPRPGSDPPRNQPKSTLFGMGVEAVDSAPHAAQGEAAVMAASPAAASTGQPQPAAPARAAPRPGVRPTPGPIEDAEFTATREVSAPRAGQARGGLASPRPAPPGRNRGRPDSHRPPPSRPLYVHDDDEPARPRRRSTGRSLVVAAMLVATGAGGLWLWQKTSTGARAKPAPDPVRPILARGELEFAKASEAGFRAAIAEFEGAAELVTSDVRVLTALARSHAALAQSLAFRASDLEARIESEQDTSISSKIQSLRDQIEDHVEKSRHHGETAVRREPRRTEAVLALADALRLSEDPQGAAQQLNKARGMLTSPTAELYYVAALLAMAKAGGDPQAAGESASDAIREEPNHWRARLLLARAHLAAGATEEAAREIAAVRRGVPGHEEARELADRIEQAPPAAAQSDPPDPVPPTTPNESSPPSSSDPPAGPQPPKDSETRTRNADSPRRDYTGYVGRGNEYLENGDVSRARDMFDRALTLRARGAAALSGLGYVALETGKPAIAVSRFKPAVQQGYAEAFIGLGDAYRRLGDSARAIEAYRGYLILRPDGPRAYLARRQLEQLENKARETPAAPEGEPSATPLPPPAEPPAAPVSEDPLPPAPPPPQPLPPSEPSSPPGSSDPPSPDPP